MVWFKVDDTLAFHAKVIAAGNAAMGLWVRAGSWSAQQLTDGFVPEHVALSMGTARQASALVSAGLWERAPGGYAFHDWTEDERQPTREQVASKREQWREKKRRQRAKGAENTGRDQQGRFSVPGGHDRDSPGESQGVSPLSRPVPSRPPTYVGGEGTDRSSEVETRAPRAVALPAGWGPSAEHHARCLEGGIDLAREVRQFRDHARANARTAVDWDAAFSVWLGNARPVPQDQNLDRQGQVLAREMRRAQAGADVIDFPQITTGGTA